MEEWKRVLFSRRRVLVLVLLAAVCVLRLCSPGIVAFQQQWRGYQEKLLNAYAGQPLEAAMEDLLARTEGGTHLSMEYSGMFQQVEYQLGFPDYLADIQARAENMSTVSIFAGSAESRANIQKTAQDYRRLEGVALTLGHDRPVETVLQQGSTDWLLCIYILLIVYTFLAERKRGLWNTVCASPRGRGNLAAWRLGSLAAAAVLGSFLLTAAEVVCAYSVCGGWNELGRMAQSASLLKNWTIPMPMWQLWMVYACLRTACVFFVGCFAWFLMEALSDRRLILPVWAGVVALEYGLRLLPEGNFLRIFNIFTYLQPRKLLLEYRNIPLFSHPFGQIPLLLTVGAVLSAGMVLGIFFIYRKRKPVDSYSWLNRMLDGLGRLFAPLGSHCSLLGHELHKNLATGRGWLIILGALAAAMLLASPSAGMDDPWVDTNLESYFRQSQGPIGPETDDYLAMRQERLDGYYAQREEAMALYEAGALPEEDYRWELDRFSQLDQQQMALDRYRVQLDHLKETPGSYMLPHWVFGTLLGVTGSQTNMTMVIGAVAVVLLLLAQAGTERRTGMLRSRRATPRGRRDSLLQRHCAAWLVTILLSAALWTSYLCLLWADYGALPWLEAPVRCLVYFENFTGNVSILGYYLLLVGYRTLGLCLLSSATLAITEMGAVYGNQN